MIIQVCAETDTGLSRKNNEDHYLTDRENGLFIVADGMGGHAAGEIASQIAVDSVQQFLTSTHRNQPLQQLRTAFMKANQAVEHAANDNPAWHGMGTTLSVLLCHQNRGYLAHVGDSRIYLLRNSQFTQLTDDHSLVGEQIRQGLLTPKQAQLSTLGNILLQAIGITPELDICLKTFPLLEKDLFLLCSDGLSDMVTEAEITTILKQNEPLASLCQQLINKALAAGGKDNVTVLMVQIGKFNKQPLSIAK